MTRKELNIMMFPWLAFGHFIPYLHLANKLAERGHKVTYLLPHKAKLQLEKQNQHPSLITFVTFQVPSIANLPSGVETTAEISLSQHGDLANALDLARPEIESIVSSRDPKPDFILYDLAYWVPDMVDKVGIKSVSYNIVCGVSLDLIRPLDGKETQIWDTIPKWSKKQGDSNSTDVHEGLKSLQRLLTGLSTPDAIAIRTCREVEGESCNRIAKRFGKPVLLSGMTLPDPSEPLDPRWVEWLEGFEPGSVIFCCLGSQHVLDKLQLQELALGLEMTGRPFLLAVKPPVGFTTLEDVLPEGFEERVGDRGVAHMGWVQQPQILAHPSVGCFVCHCGSSSMWEALVSKAQLVLFPQIPDQALNAKLMAEQLMVGVELDRAEDGGVSGEVLYNAIKCVMDEQSEIGSTVKKNHAKWSDLLTREGFVDEYIDSFIGDLYQLDSS